MISRLGRPCSSTAACILVVRPPRERPISCASAPLFRPQQSGEPSRGSHRASGHKVALPLPPAARTVVPRRLLQPSAQSDCRASYTARSCSEHLSIGSPIEEHARCRKSPAGHQHAERPAYLAATAAKDARIDDHSARIHLASQLSSESLNHFLADSKTKFMGLQPSASGEKAWHRLFAKWCCA